MPKVSIIIAAYNIEDYIKRCLISCMNQSFKDIEIIVVNDGSTDNTLNIINKCKSKDSRIKIVDKSNEGLIEARKSGFNIASGEYVLFIDGDDWINLSAIEILYNKAKEKDYDIVSYNYLLKYDNGKEINGWDSNIKIDENKNLLEVLFHNQICHTIWSKLVKRNFIIDNGIEFPSNISYGEDLALVYTLAMYNPTFTIINKPLYYYYQRSDSLDNNVSQKTLEIIKAVEFIKFQLTKKDLLDKYKEEYEYLVFIQTYYLRKEYIFKNTNKISKQLHYNWKKLNINLKCNYLYRELYKYDSKKHY